MKTPVLLLDWNASGHHLTYMRSYIQALAALEIPVMALGSSPSSLEDLREENGASRVATGRLQRFRFKRPWPQPLRSFLNRRAMSASLRRGMRNCASMFGCRPSLLFFNTIYHQDAGILSRLAAISGLPYSGLLLHSPPARSDKKSAALEQLMGNPKCRAYGVLDETFAVKTAPSGRAVLFPDISDGSFSKDHPVIGELRQFARGRPLVLAIGHLQPSKGVAALAKIAIRPENEDIAFAFIGEISWSMFTQEETAILKTAKQNLKNCHFKEGRMPDGFPYNGCVHACDILFAAYRNFPHSSNTLTKGAMFEKPVIVSDGHLMASRVRAFRLGEIVRQDNEDDILRAIRRIANAAPSWARLASPRWADYRDLHSSKTLEDSFARLIGLYGTP
jgi:glycosyltransferase involved in cell wall biosynthesis